MMRLLAFGLLILLSLPSAALAQRRERVQEPPRPVFADDSSKRFQSLFAYKKITPVHALPGHLPEDLQNTIIVVYGYQPGPGCWDLEDIQLLTRRALDRGAAVLIIDDGLGTLNDFLPQGLNENLTFVSGPVEAESMYAVPTKPTKLDEIEAGLLKSSVPELQWFGDLERVRFPNDGVNFVRRAGIPKQKSRIVARFPDGAMTFSKFGRPIRLGANDALAVALCGRGKETHRLGVLASSSILTNRMLLTSGSPPPNDTDNFRFAFQTVQWLQGPELRSQCIFFEDGRLVEDFDHVDWAQAQSPQILPKVPPFLPNINWWDRELQEKVAITADGMLEKMEENHSPDKALTKGNSDRSFLELMSLLGILAVPVLLILAIRHTRATTHLRDYQPIPRDPLQLGPDVTIGSFEHRRLETLRADNLLMPVREFLRNMFFEQGVPTDTPDGSHMPPIQITARSSRKLRDDLKELWELAFGTKRKTLTLSQWKELEPMITSIHAAATDGLWVATPLGGDR